MLDFIYWASGIIIPILLGYGFYRYMRKVEDVDIQQQGEKMDGVKGADFQLTDGDDLHIKNMRISQSATEMKNVTGLSFKVDGKQSARLQGVEIEQPHAQVIISDDPNVRVEINKQG